MACSTLKIVIFGPFFSDRRWSLERIATLSGLVYAWGDNRHGQIGLEGGKKEQIDRSIDKINL